MGWKTGLEGLNWIVVLPPVLQGIAHSDVGELALGAFGAPASVTLSRWLMLAGGMAAATALSTRSARMAVLSAAAFASLGGVAYQHRGGSTRNVEFPGADITIAATVYQPRAAGPHPAVVLVHGSAPLRRGFYSFWAERLARKGVIVVVPDKRGVGGTGGTFERNNNTSHANLELLASDVSAALDYAASVTGVDTTRLGLFGLSQAGWVAPMAALRSNRARFLLLVTAPTVSVREEGAWSRLRGDDQRKALYDVRAAERIADTVTAGGVDARPMLGALGIPGLWLFGADDNSNPTRKSIAVLDSLRRVGKTFDAITYPDAGHLLITRSGGLLPHAVHGSWDAMARWISALPSQRASESSARRTSPR